MAQNTIIISSESLSSDDLLETSPDDSSDSGRRQIPNRPVMSSNKSSTFLTKHRSNIEETPLKQPHPDTFTSKEETLEVIKRLHIKCGFLYNEHIFMLPKTWLDYQQYTQNFYNVYCTHKYFLLRRISRDRIPKATVLVNIFRVFLWRISLRNAGSRSIIHCWEK